MNPLNAVARLYDWSQPPTPRFLGTCFAFRLPTHFLTAAHCINNFDHKHLTVILSNGTALEVKSITKHSQADLAILIVSEAKEGLIEPFWDCLKPSLAEEFIAYGFPEDVIGPNNGIPTPRVFKGYYQRFMNHKSHLGYEYTAGELSIACPGGLSGGPLFRPTAPQIITAIVSENIETSTQLHYEEILSTETKTERNYYRYIINYGVAVILMTIKSWLDENIPQRVPTA